MKLLFDSHGIGFKAAFALDLSNDNAHTGVIYGFFRDMLTLAKTFETNEFMFFFDSRKSLRRHEHPWYKNKRNEDPQIRAVKQIAHPQLDALRKDILPSIGFNNVHIQAGYESDDLIARYVIENNFSDNPEQLIIISSDQDLYQLLGKHCSMWLPGKKAIYDEEMFKEEWGIQPVQWAFVKALGGCKSDDVPGIAGVAEKTAASFIRGELKAGHKKYQSIVSEDGKAIEARNLPIVKLPMEGTRLVEYTPDKLDFTRFRDVCSEYGFTSFRRNLEEWKRWIFKKEKRKQII